MILQLLAYVLAFAVPIVAAAVLLPSYAPVIVIGGIGLFLVTSGFILGWEWESRDWTSEARSHLRRILLLFVGIPVARATMDAIREPERLVFYVILLVTLELGLAITTVPAFYLGRAMHRRTTTGA